MDLVQINNELDKLEVKDLSTAIKDNLLSNIRDLVCNNNCKVKINSSLDLENIDDVVEQLEYDVDEIITNFVSDCIVLEGEDICL